MKHSHKKSFDWYSMQQRYSIRKYYFGAASVLLGTALVLGAAASVQTVQAEENKQETTNSISVGRGEAATKPAEVSASNKEKTYAAPTVANPVETTPVKTEEVTKPAEKVEEAKDKKEEVTHQDAVDKSKLLTALSRAKKLESKLYTEASAANLQTSIQAGQSLLGKADATEAELSAAESSIQSFIIGLELRPNSNKGTVSETPVAKKANIVEAKEETNPAATTDRSAVDSAVLPTSTAAKVETTSAPASTNEILKPGLSLSDARQNPAIRKEDVDRGYSGFRTAGSGFRAAGPENKPILNPNNTIAFSDISQGSHSFRGIGHSRGGREIHYDVTTVRRGNNINFTINYFAPGNLREFVNNNFILDKGTGYGEPTPATVITPNLRNQVKNISKGGNFVSHSGYSLEAAVETNKSQTITFSLPITNPNGDLSLRLRPVEFNVDQGGSGTGTSNDPYSNSNYYFETDPLYLDANPNQANPLTTSFNTKVDFQTLYIPTTKLAEGVTELVSEGVEGEKSQAYRLHKFGDQYVLGLPVGNATTVTAAKPRVMKYGIGKIAATQNKTGDTNHIKFYLDKDGDGVFNNQDEVILNTDIKDGERGPTGATGAQGPAGPKGEQGNPGTPGKDGKSLIAVKNGTETKVYVEDPARPGQPLNPNQPLATITDGRNGTNGQSPTITATRSVQNGKNGVLVTITPVGGRPQTTFVEDGQKGADGKTPTVTITEGQNGTHTLTVHNPGSPDVTTTIRDGATGQAGRDGKDVLNGKVNPQPNQGKNGDKYINTETGDVYVKNNGNWDKEGNIKGPKGDKGADGAKGEKGDQGERGLTGAQGAKGADGAVGRDGRDGKDVLNGKANPEAHQGKDGDKYVNTETGDVFVKNNGNWDKEGNIKGPKGDKGERGEDGKTPEVTVTPGKDGHSTDITFTVPGKDPVTVNVKDGENGLNGKTPKVDLLRVQGKNGNPSHTIVTFYTDENNDGKYTPGTDELLGSEMIKDGAKGADGRDGKSLLTVKDGKETKVYQEDPANPGQPLNPEKPLAVIRDGVDGKSPTVTAVRKDEAGHKGVEITVDNHDGSQPTTVFVQDGAKGETGATGQDGQTPTITTQRGQDGQSTVVTITT
ncbi:TPA: YSIRK-type signal peptide-containing protein, partial [Streptococcus pneumoniae]